MTERVEMRLPMTLWLLCVGGVGCDPGGRLGGVRAGGLTAYSSGQG